MTNIRFCNSLIYDKLPLAIIQGDSIMKSAYISYILALLLFGSNGIIASYIALSSTEIVLYRTLIGSILLLFLFTVTKNKWTFYKYKKHFGYLTLSGVAMGLSWMFLYEAYNRIGVSISSLLYYCGPVIVILLAPIVFKEKLTVHKLVGLFSVFIGIIFVNGNLVNGIRDLSGVFYGMMSAIMYAFMVIFNKKATNISGLENSLLQLAISCITVAVFILFRGDFIFAIPQDSIFPLFFLGLVNTGIGCYLYFSKLDKLPVQSVSILGYIEPLSAVILSVIILKETLTAMQIIGAVLVLGGAIYAETTDN